MTPRLLPLVLAVLATGCSDPVAPKLTDGTYTLATIDGAAPPVLRLATITCDYTVTGATLSIGPGNAAVFDVQETYDCSRGGGQVTVGGRTYPGAFTQTGTHFVLTSPIQGGSPIQLMGSVHQSDAIELDDPETYAVGPGVLRLNR